MTATTNIIAARSAKSRPCLTFTASGLGSFRPRRSTPEHAPPRGHDAASDNVSAFVISVIPVEGTYADDLAELVQKLDLKNAIHVGHSTGGGEVARYIG
jgi:pimeloyl-ACP methyl ester carboxylesterase